MEEKPRKTSKIGSFLYSINYVYYGFYFLFFASLQICHVLLITPSNGSLQVLYSVLAFFESFIEVALMAFVSGYLLQRGKKNWNRVFLFFTSLLLLCRIIDFILVRLMDISIWHGLEFIIQETFVNFIEMLYATNLPLSVWIGGFFIAMAAVALCWGFFYYTSKLCQKKPFVCTAKNATSMIVLSFVCLGIGDVVLHILQIPIALEREYEKSLPWKTSFFSQEEESFLLDGNLKKISREKNFFCGADSEIFSLERKPDLFLFVVESLRKDFLSEEVTPTLVQFREENHHFSQALSVSNATQTSWFSIFYSLYPFYWTQYCDKNHVQGSPCLSLLKKMGYQIHVYSASRLSFYSMKSVLFGDEGTLVHSLQEFQEDTPIAPYQADANLMSTLCRDVQKSDQKGGRVFIVFLDSTHFDYSWPEDQEVLFSPFESDFNYIKMSYVRDNLNEVKNRYKNSLFYVDSLFKKFRQSLEEKGLWEDSVVVFTADHGEEFDEYGHMFHASSLSPPQLEIPLYIKLGQKNSAFSLHTQEKVSQMDIFPTFFHYILGEDLVSSFLQGGSLLAPSARPYVIGTRYNASRTPYQFYIDSGPYRMILEFANRHDVFHCNHLKVHSIEDENGEKVPFSISLVTAYFQEALHALFGPSCL